MIHYHGGPITPETVALRAWSRRHAFISFAHRSQIRLASAICQSFALDNGAFSAWRKGEPVADWSGYYKWAGSWLTHPACDWAVIPDVIGGDEAANDALVDEWPHGHRGVPVWHLDESVDRLVRLAERWPRVALGSCAEWNVAKPAQCLIRLEEALGAISDKRGRPKCKLHGLRMMRSEIAGKIPLSSADSTTVSRGHGLDVRWKGTMAPATREARADVIVDRLESTVTPGSLRKFWNNDE
jgi:hypothetical protein